MAKKHISLDTFQLKYDVFMNDSFIKDLFLIPKNIYFPRMGESKRCLGECEKCLPVVQPIKYGDYLYAGQKTFSSKHRYKPSIEELPGVFERDEHLITLNELVERLDTDLEKGLTEEQVLSIRERFGLNVTSIPESNKWMKFRISLRSNYFFHLSGIVFCFTTAALSYPPVKYTILHNVILGFEMVLLTLFTASISYWQEEKSSQIMNSFKDLYPQYASVIREGEKKRIRRQDIVVGDLVLVKAGNIIPADLRITQAWNLLVDELPLICRREAVKKTPDYSSHNPAVTENLAFYGTLCMEGYGQGLAVATGKQTVYAQMMNKTVAQQKMSTVLHKIVRKMLRTIGAITLFVCIIMFAITTTIEHLWTTAFLLILAQIITSMPDILYSMITSCLSIAAHKMASSHCLPKDYEAVEALSGTNVICCDKTGTITQNRMTVVRLWLDGRIINVEPSQDNKKMKLDSTPSSPTYDAFVRTACLCSTTASKSRRNRCVIKKGCSCDQTEVAIMEFMNSTAKEESATETINCMRERYERVFEIPFSSCRKYHVTIHDTTHSSPSQGCEFLLCIKGAVEVILQFCSTVLIEGEDKPISYLVDSGFQEKLENLMENGERIIGFCDYMMPKDQFPHTHVFQEKDIEFTGFRFLGVTSILDHPRPSAPEAIAKCRAAGIKVILMTGDHPLTGKAVARQVGIISRNTETRDEVARRFNISTEQVTPGSVDAVVVTGSEMELLSKEGIRKILKDHTEIVFARISPSQKLDIVESLQEDGKVVALSGDSPEDCLAMMRADVGIGMGMHGSEISRESADIILLGDNFDSIVAGIEEGRKVCHSVKKAIVYVLSSNFPEVTPLLFVVSLAIPLPISPIIILLITLLAEMFPVLFLAQEKAEKDIMLRKSSGLTTIIDRRLIHKAYLQIGVIGFVSGMFAYFAEMSAHGFMPAQVLGIKRLWDSPAINDLRDSFNQEWAYSSRKELECTCQTAFFATIIILQWFNVAVCRTRRKSAVRYDFRNSSLIISISIQVLVIAFLMYTPGLLHAFSLRPLRFTTWLLGVPFGLFFLVCEELRRYVIRHRTKNSWFDRETF